MRIGLIALSGVRVHNPKLMQLGLTLPGFIDRAEVIASMPSLGLLTIAAHLPEHHELEYLEVDALEEASDLAFDLVALSSFTARAKDMYALADRLREAGTTVILGGLHVSQLPEEAAGHADAVVVGEGELAFARAVSDHEQGKLQKLYDGRRDNVDLGRSRTPRYDLLEAGKYNRMPVQTTRGCPLACDFCGASRTFSTYKKKPVLQAMRDLEAAKSAAQHPFIELADDNSFVDKRWGKHLVTAMGHAGVKWFTETDISVADDPELLDLLAESGCRQLLIGIESPDREGLVQLDPANWKLDRHEGALRAIDAIQSRGISVNGCFIVGLDAHGPSVFEDVQRFVERSELTEVQVTVQTAFPGTELYRRLKLQGRLLDPTAWELCTLFDVNFEPARMTVSELELGLEQLMTSLYSDAQRHQRRRLFAAKRRQVQRSGPE